LAVLGLVALSGAPALAQPGPSQTIACDVFIAGGGLGGVAAALEALGLGKRVCMSEITDWIGGQVSQQGVSALDERPLQRETNLFPYGYSQFRRRVREKYHGDPNPGKCWVSELCFAPRVGVQVLREMLDPYLRTGQLALFTDTVVKDLDIEGNRIRSVTTLTHAARDPARGPNSLPLSHFLRDWYDPEPSERFSKRLTRFVPPPDRGGHRLDWMVIDATETGELLPLAGVPYRLGTDRWIPQEPSASTLGADPYCTQGFTYTFVMERTADHQPLPEKPPGYDQPYHGRYYSYELPRFNFTNIFTYRRIHGSAEWNGPEPLRPGDRTMQNWTWGNDWRLSTAENNFVLTHEQLLASGQLQKGRWQGGLRPEALALAEAHAQGYFWWLVAGTSDYLLQKQDPTYSKPLYPNHVMLRGTESPMGTDHGLSRHPYIREGRRLVGRPSIGYPNGFTIYETDISRARQNPVLNPERPYLFYDGVGIGQYPIDFHPCVVNLDFERSPYEALDAPSPSFPYQVPLRALIPQKLDNLLAGAKNIATTHISNGAYRVHPVEWSIGAAAGTVAALALDRDATPQDFVEQTPEGSRLLSELQTILERRGNPYRIPGATIFATKWADYR
jgi:hypothetical protein